MGSAGDGGFSHAGVVSTGGGGAPSDGGVPSEAGADARGGATDGGRSGDAAGDGGVSSGGVSSGDAAGDGGVSSGGVSSGGEAGNGGIPGDINEDGCVDLNDYAILGRDFGCAVETCGDPRADLQGDGWIDVFDYLIFLQHWYEGTTCRVVCEPDSTGAGGQGNGGFGGADATPDVGSPDLDGNGCVDFADLELLAPSYGCRVDDCAAPGTDIVQDGCVNNDDVNSWRDAFDQGDRCDLP
jgi:hypothetical protein